VSLVVPLRRSPIGHGRRMKYILVARKWCGRTGKAVGDNAQQQGCMRHAALLHAATVAM
jgi:hypothetical protein